MSTNNPPALQFVFRDDVGAASGKLAHFQLGHPTAYKSLDVRLKTATFMRLQEVALQAVQVASLAGHGSTVYSLVPDLSVFSSCPGFLDLVYEFVQENVGDADLWDGTTPEDDNQWFEIRLAVRANLAYDHDPEKWDWPTLLELPKDHIDVFEVINLSRSGHTDEQQLAQGLEEALEIKDAEAKAKVAEAKNKFREVFDSIVDAGWEGPATDVDQWRLVLDELTRLGVRLAPNRVTRKGFPNANRGSALCVNIEDAALKLQLGPGRGWRIFDAVRQVEEPSTSTYKGTGWREHMASDIRDTVCGLTALAAS